MKRTKRLLLLCLIVMSVVCLTSQPAFAVTEDEVQAQVDSIGKDAVAGNIFVWFLCAVGFLKISQKIDSFMSSLGINVGNTGGSLMAEAVIAARGFDTVRGFGGFRGGGKYSTGASGSASGGSTSGGFLSGGLAGVVSRQVTKGAVNATTAPESGPGSGVSGGIGGRFYASSVANGGKFANSVIGSVATGNIASTGSITGAKATEALTSYMGYAAMEEGAKNIPKFSNVEIGGGRITGTETSDEHPEGIAFAMYHTEQYTAPEGDFTTVYSADGISWYKQYAQDAVVRTPYKAPDGTVAHMESIEKKLPPVPRRKDKL